MKKRFVDTFGAKLWLFFAGGVAVMFLILAFIAIFLYVNFASNPISFFATIGVIFVAMYFTTTFFHELKSYKNLRSGSVK